MWRSSRRPRRCYSPCRAMCGPRWALQNQSVSSPSCPLSLPSHRCAACGSPSERVTRRKRWFLRWVGGCQQLQESGYSIQPPFWEDFQWEIEKRGCFQSTTIVFVHKTPQIADGSHMCPPNKRATLLREETKGFPFCPICRVLQEILPCSLASDRVSLS